MSNSRSIGRWGSSPRPRGAHVLRYRRRCYRGLIPASAGSTTGPASPRPAPWAHPRVRGEHHVPDETPPIKVGSSPRPRGALLGVAAPDHLLGLIPASAGSTTPRATPARRSRAHPRVRGEHTDDRLASMFAQGSSPRPRGAPAESAGDAGDAGLIPASAGSTLERRQGQHSRRAHPRVRGEHVVLVQVLTEGQGSSPRPRGARCPDRRARTRAGLIPASAGSTATACP